FEADTINFDLLEKNCAHLHGVELLHAAVWTHDGEVAFTVKGGEGGHLAAVSASRIASAMVPSIRLRPLLRAHVDVLKMDIEGAEIEVLRDCADALENVDRLFVEYHSFVGRDQCLGSTISILEAAGFRIHAHVELPSRRPFEELLLYNEKDLRLNLFAFRDHVKPTFKLLD